MKDPERLLASDATQWEARLLRAAYGDEPTADARAQLLRKLGLHGAPAAAATTESLLPRGARSATHKLAAKWLVLAGTGAALLGALPFVLRSTQQPVAQTAHSTRAQNAHDAHAPEEAQASAPAAVGSTTVAAAPAVEPTVQPHTAGRTSTSLAASLSMPLSLAAELASLERARAQLRHQDPSGALSQLALYDRRYPHGTLREEALALRCEALLAHGDSAEATHTARAFLRRYPRSVHAVRIRAQLAQTGDAH